MEQYGEWSIVSRTVPLLALMVGTGLGMTATKHLAEHRELSPDKAGWMLSATLVVGFVSAFVVWLTLLSGGGWIARSVLDASALSGMLRLSGPAEILIGMVSIVTGALASITAIAGIMAFGCILLVACSEFPPVVLLTLSLTGWLQLKGVMLALTCSSALSCLLASLFLTRASRRQGVTMLWRQLGPEVRTVRGFTTPLWIGGWLSVIALWPPQILLMRHTGGTAELAAFAASDQMRMLATFLPAVLETVVLPTSGLTSFI